MREFHSQVRRAVKIVGGQTKLAEAIGCAQSEVWRLCNTAQSIQGDVAVKISRATGGEVSIADLMPDLVEAVRAELERAADPQVAA